jgi:poly(3-hydroxybutyrate) depolymerase
MLAHPAKSAPNPYNYNQPCVGNQRCAGQWGGAMAQLSLHGTADQVIPYHGGPRFNSPTYILMDEPASDHMWAVQNNCTGGVSNTTNIPATYHNISTTATVSVWVGCPLTAPVELYTVFGAPHGAADTIRGADQMATVLDFFAKVEAAHGGKPAPPFPPPSPPPSPPLPHPQPPRPSDSNAAEGTPPVSRLGLSAALRALVVAF